ncbi:M23 family metallopeptidase [Aquabacter cavernae]|uniref:M23 family metallopeptidase n=1 Tax=Aquabacter cavernae TaxID=2496029 RepID=UPI001FDF4006|nr:M23 family metallopeptidase [Aquabacter cavernae]
MTGSLGAAPTGRVDAGPIGAPYQAAQFPAPSAPPVAYAPTTPAVSPYPSPVQAAVPRTAGAAHVVVGGETLTSIARSYNMTPAQLAASNGISADAPLRIGQPLIVPQSATGNLAAGVPAPRAVQPVMATAPVAAPVAPPVAKPAAVAVAPVVAPVAAAATKPVVQAAAPLAAAAAPVAVAAATPAAAKPAATPAKPAVAAAAAEEADDSPRAAGSGPQFRAPVRGRVISSFGPKPGGTRNDGVNFAVPEGTSVRSAEDGTVAYAGNELKGYGNLVLVKHADGYVTAYAHASELLVKRGDTVRRGQIIAKAGQSGGVATPQLHFEIRKGSQPVDPSQYVAGL